MTRIDGATVYSDTFNIIYDCVSGILTGSLKGIYSFFPDIGGANFPGYPICTISSADVASKAATIGSNFINVSDVGVSIVLYSKSMNGQAVV